MVLSYNYRGAELDIICITGTLSTEQLLCCMELGKGLAVHISHLSQYHHIPNIHTLTHTYTHVDTQTYTSTLTQMHTQFRKFDKSSMICQNLSIHPTLNANKFVNFSTVQVIIVKIMNYEF